MLPAMQPPLLRPGGSRAITTRPIATPLAGVGASSRSARQHLRRGCAKRLSADSTLPVAAAAASQQGPSSPDDELPQHSSEGGRQLLAVATLAFCTLLAAVAKERAALSPIVPPLLPAIHTLASTTSPAAGGALQPIVLAHTPAAASAVLVGDAASAQRSSSSGSSSGSSGPVRASKALLRALWGTAVAPVKLVDALLFPDEAIVRPPAPLAAPAAPEPVRLVSIPAAAPAPATLAPAALVVAAPVPAAAATAASTGIVPDAHAAAAGQALHALSEQLQALAGQLSAGSEGLLGQLQQAAASARAGMGGGQGITAAAAEDAASAAQEEAAPPPAAADAAGAAGDQTAAALLLLRNLMGSDAMSLLPVLVVTCATAAAGLALAAVMAGGAGLVDRRRATTPAQRAAQAALLDSPLRPISCPSWPAAMHYLPSDLAISYRWRGEGEGRDGAGSSSGSEAAASSESASIVQSAAGDATLLSAAAKALEGTQWSFSQISAYRHWAHMRQPSPRRVSGSSSTPGGDAAALLARVAPASSPSSISIRGDAIAVEPEPFCYDVVAEEPLWRQPSASDSGDDDEAGRRSYTIVERSSSSEQDSAQDSKQDSKEAAAHRLEQSLARLEYGTMQAAAAAGGDAPAALADEPAYTLDWGLEYGPLQAAAAGGDAPAALADVYTPLYAPDFHDLQPWPRCALEDSGASSASEQPRGGSSGSAGSGAAPAAAGGKKQASAAAVAAAAKSGKAAAAAASKGGQAAAAAAQEGKAPAAASKGAADQAGDVLASVRQVLGLPAGNGTSKAAAPATADAILPNRLVLLICQAMLQRGDGAERQLRGVVAFLAKDQAVGRSVRRQVPVMLAGCLEAMFAGEDWDRPGSRVREVMASLAAALPAGSYSRLQRQLMARGLLREVEVPVEFAADE